MKAKIVIGLLTIAAILGWTGVAGAQTAPPTPKLQLPSGETVWDLSGDWMRFSRTTEHEHTMASIPRCGESRRPAALLAAFA